MTKSSISQLECIFIFYNIMFSFPRVLNPNYTDYLQLLLLHTVFAIKGRTKNGFEPIYIRLTCRPSTLEMRNISTAANKRNNIKRRIRAIYYWYNTRSSGRIMLVLQLFYPSCIALFTTTRTFPFFVQAPQTSVKTTVIWLVTCMIGRAKNLVSLVQSLLTKLVIIYAVTFQLVICIMYVF